MLFRSPGRDAKMKSHHIRKSKILNYQITFATDSMSNSVGVAEIIPLLGHLKAVPCIMVQVLFHEVRCLSNIFRDVTVEDGNVVDVRIDIIGNEWTVLKVKKLANFKKLR